ncbi:an1-type zinc finger protein 6 [Stylonychia lemnae]|uniref:An1-type zinc finger protein 6 n=1 Tax=Stylonychia lemnae TaxID=5949 RepID=A0A078A680_STYLE|nr:an1-type zinc finger protein 6 [Stylonychia lemnae]|eukprot:CDW77075.1 an1-type zinc finger protein 6 [Stylonychia lemnae]
MNSQRDQSLPVLCNNCHTFYGNHQTNFLCSTCYKDLEQQFKMDSLKELELQNNEGQSNDFQSSQLSEQSQNQSQNESTQPNAEASGEEMNPEASSQDQNLNIQGQNLENLIQSNNELPSKPAQVNKSACWQCQRKVGLLGFPCKCEYIFCGKHRYAEEHHCQFDFKFEHQEKIWRENPQIKKDKLNRV